MINIKNIAKSIAVLALLVGVGFASPALADNNNDNGDKAFLNAQASLKADLLAKWDSAVGVVLGQNNALRVMGAKVVAVSGSDIKATASFGDEVINFTVKTDAETKLNGKALASGTLSDLKAGDKISFGGTLVSSSSSSMVVDASHVVSQALYKATPQPDDNDDSKINGEVRKEERERGFFGKFRNWFWK